MSANASLETKWFRTEPVSPVLGARIRGVDLAAPISDPLFAAVNSAFLHHKVLIFSDQRLNTEAHARFSELFGQLQVHVLNQYHASGRADVMEITNLDECGRPRGEHPDPGACIWHTDGSWQSEPVLATSLFAVRIPPAGGDTLFADASAAYRALDTQTRALCDGLVVVHDLNHSRSRSGARVQMTEAQRHAAPPVDHPLVKRHPETGEPVLYLGEHAAHVVGMPLESGRALIRRLNAHITSEPFVYRHRWRVGELVIWDNRSVLHKATEFDAAHHARVLRRTTVLGTAVRVPAAHPGA